MSNIAFGLAPPQITIYTDDMPENSGGTAKAFLVKIRPKYRDDAGLHAHESRHVAQWWVWVLIGCVLAAALAVLPHLSAWAAFWPLPIIFMGAAERLAYQFVPAYRLWCEVDAYWVQQSFYQDDRGPAFAEFIASGYGLAITPEQALARLKAHND